MRSPDSRSINPDLSTVPRFFPRFWAGPVIGGFKSKEAHLSTGLLWVVPLAVVPSLQKQTIIQQNMKAAHARLNNPMNYKHMVPIFSPRGHPSMSSPAMMVVKKEISHGKPVHASEDLGTSQQYI